MLENNSSDSSDCCKNCVKNMNLIKKYEKLTHLYQKKQLKLSMNGSSCISNGKSTNNTIDLHIIDNPCIKMVETLNRMLRSRYLNFFRMPMTKSAKKYILLTIFNKLDRISKAKGFAKIKSFSYRSTSSIEQVLTSKLRSTLKSALTSIKYSSGISVTK